MPEPPQPTPDSESILAAALAYAIRGWYVFPVHAPARKGGCTCGHADCTNIGKHPLTRNGLKDASIDEAVIRAWWKKWPWANVAIVTGMKSGLLVLDIDILKGGVESFTAIQEQYGPLTSSLTSNTGSGGAHLLYAHPGAGYLLRNAQRLDGYAGLDVRGDGGYIVAPPSRHWAGTRYAWNLAKEPVRPMPDWLLTLLQHERDSGEGERIDRAPGDATPAEAQDAITHWTDKALPRAVEGARNGTAFWWACQLRDAGVSQLDAESAAGMFYDGLADKGGFALREVYNAIRSAYRQGPRERARSKSPLPFRKVTQPITHGALALANTSDDPPEPPGDATDDAAPHCTDMGNARRFVARFGEDARYVATWNQWLIWDGKRWRRDGTGEAARLAKQTVRSIYAEASDAEDDYRRKDLVKWAMKSEADSRIKAMLSQGQTEPEIAVDADAFDAQPWLFTVANGTIDLCTGTLLPHDRAHRITRMSRVIYDAKAQCPTWLAFLSRIMAGNERVMTFLQRAVGYSLTDDTTEQVLFLLHGGGQNGKSKLLEAIEGIVGDYGMQTPTTTLMAKRDNSIPNDVARLKGARFVKAIETEEGHSLAESLVKQMTGGDMLSARFMRGEWFDFRPTFKLWLAANHLPTIRGSDDGIWRRIRYIPFSVQIPENERDATLGDKLRAEYPGILAWAVRGCLDWQREGLGYPDEIREATRQYREQMDHFGRFVGDCCVLDKKCQIGAKALRISYEQWCEDNGERPRSQTWIGRELQRLGMLRSKDSCGLTLYTGIGLRSQQP